MFVVSGPIILGFFGIVDNGLNMCLFNLFCVQQSRTHRPRRRSIINVLGRILPKIITKTSFTINYNLTLRFFFKFDIDTETLRYTVYLDDFHCKR